MTSMKKYLITYYIVFVLNIIYLFFINSLINDLILLNILLAIVFSICLLKFKVKSASFLFPLFYLVYFFIICLLIYLINFKVIIPGSHIMYYSTFINIGYLLLNIYSFLCLEKKDKKEKKHA